MLNTTLSLLTTGLFIMPFWGNCQTVLNAGGQTAIVGAFTLTYSIGEPVTETESVDIYALTQGFLQPEMAGTIVGAFTAGAQALEVNIFPNPASNFVFLTTDVAIRQPVFIQWFAADGRRVMTDQMEPGDSQICMNTQDMSAGAYQLCLSSEDSNSVFCFSVLVQK